MDNKKPEEEFVTQPPNETPDREEGELGEEELNDVSGGIIIVSGHISPSQKANTFTNHADWHALNPQPIPPGRTN